MCCLSLSLSGQNLHLYSVTISWESFYTTHTAQHEFALHLNCYLDTTHLTLLSNLTNFCTQPFFFFGSCLPPSSPSTVTSLPTPLPTPSYLPWLLWERSQRKFLQLSHWLCYVIYYLTHTDTHTHASMKSIYHRKTHALYAVHTHTTIRFVILQNW